MRARSDEKRYCGAPPHRCGLDASLHRSHKKAASAELTSASRAGEG